MRSSTYYENDNDNLVSGFDASTFAGDNVYEIIGNKDSIINYDSIVWVNTNKIILEESVIKVPYSNLA